MSDYEDFLAMGFPLLPSDWRWGVYTRVYDHPNPAENLSRWRETEIWIHSSTSGYLAGGNALTREDVSDKVKLDHIRTLAYTVYESYYTNKALDIMKRNVAFFPKPKPITK